MACIPEWFLYCDADGCPSESTAFEGHAIGSPADQRREARAAGWRRRKVGGHLLDLCPACVARLRHPTAPKGRKVH